MDCDQLAYARACPKRHKRYFCSSADQSCHTRRVANWASSAARRSLSASGPSARARRPDLSLSGLFLTRTEDSSASVSPTVAGHNKSLLPQLVSVYPVADLSSTQLFFYSSRQKWCPSGLFKTIVEHTVAELFDAATQDRSTIDTTMRVGVDRCAQQSQR